MAKLNEIGKALIQGMSGGMTKAWQDLNHTGSFTHASRTFWTYTTDYFLPNKQRFNVDGGRYGASYNAIKTIETAQEFSIALNAISREVGSSKWTVSFKADQGREAKVIEDEGQPVLKLLNHPNGLHSWQSWIETAMMLLVPTGNLYILKDPISVAGTPMSLWILRSDRTQPIRDDLPTAPVQGYLHYAEDGRRYVFPPDRVIHIKLPNPFTDYQGLGMVQLLQQTLEMDFRSMESNIQLFRQGGRLSTVIEGMADDPDKAREIKAKIIEAHTGSENAHRVLLLTGDAKLNVQASNGQPKEADYKHTREDISRGIGGMLGVPPMIMGQLDNVNRSTATVQQQLFLKNAIWPMMQRLKPAMDDIVRCFNPSFTFDWPRVDVMDPETMAVMMKNGLDGGALTPNDAREKFLQVPRSKDPAMDKHYIQSTQIAMEDIGKLPPETVQPQPTPQPQKSGKLSLPRTLGMKGVSNSFPKGTRKQRLILNAMKANRPKIEKRLAPIFEKHITEFGRKASEHYAKHGKRAYDPSGTSEGLQAKVQDEYSVVIASSAQDASEVFSDVFNVSFGGFADEGSVEVQALATDLAQRVTWMDDTLKTKLADMIQQGSDQGLNAWQIANGTTDGSFPGIKNAFEDMAQEHAMLIARTEAIHIQDAVNTEAYIAMGVTTCDVIGCEDFVIMDGEVYGCNSQLVPVSALPINFHPNHRGAVVPHID